MKSGNPSDGDRGDRVIPLPILGVLGIVDEPVRRPLRRPDILPAGNDELNSGDGWDEKGRDGFVADRGPLKRDVEPRPICKLDARE